MKSIESIEQHTHTCASLVDNKNSDHVITMERSCLQIFVHEKEQIEKGIRSKSMHAACYCQPTLGNSKQILFLLYVDVIYLLTLHSYEKVD